ncbi:3CxxC-type zinc finger protein [Aspergillus homomorphus CBS 101889]|uniref:3CxxC-type domain-containing protein n=1 Tax=Aspergillus homomorphus (strain CBS 101889) TaxID=1450537 RepID=A0A395HFR2_ASPHC|nr:hypothetical protein BO97DRAFT_439078 [Aspergillus homomorphus CBS 101889]RAL06560.1 hypothetical protein BO97DRAFT_439078 [Aspergillus homomorphus CBS 101889]
MPRKGGKAAKLWSLHPNLHADVTRLLDEEGLQLEFLDVDDEDINIEEKDTNVMGRFIYQNRGSITIRMYSQERYNARVYHQRCRNCRAVGRLILDSECYAERSRGPHDSELCEGCRVGHCPNSNEDLASVLAR